MVPPGCHTTTPLCLAFGMASPLRTDLALRARYAQGGGIHRLLPAAVAHPTTLGELSAVLRAAREAGLSVTPRGAGSAIDGSNIGEGLVLDLTAFDAGRCEVDPSTRLAVCSPSITLPMLRHAAAAHRWHLPLDPSSAPWATLGGLVGTNAAGARTVHDGAMRRWVEAVVLETDDGPLPLRRGKAPDAHHPVVQRLMRDALPLLTQQREAILARWPRTRKNTLGYDLASWWQSGDLLDLVIGAEGTLGIVTEVTVRLAPIAPHRLGLRVALVGRALLVPALEAIRRQTPAMLEFLDASFLRVVEARLVGNPSAVLLAEFEGDDAIEVARRGERARQALTALGAGVLEVAVASDPNEVAALWAIRHGASSRLAALTDGRQSLQVIEDGCVPPGRLGDYLDAVERACRAEAIDVVMFGHAGDGHVHVNLLPNLREPDWLPRVRRIFGVVNEALLRMGGTPAGEHGAGRLRAGLVERFLGPEATSAFRAIKAAFDPYGRWNPGVILPDRSDPFARLKVGEDAAPLPDGVAETLRRIEAEARWGESRWEEPRTAIGDRRTEDRTP